MFLGKCHGPVLRLHLDIWELELLCLGLAECCYVSTWQYLTWGTSDSNRVEWQIEMLQHAEGIMPKLKPFFLISWLLWKCKILCQLSKSLEGNLFKVFLINSIAVLLWKFGHATYAGHWTAWEHPQNSIFSLLPLRWVAITLEVKCGHWFACRHMHFTQVGKFKTARWFLSFLTLWPWSHKWVSTGKSLFGEVVWSLT